MSNKKERIEFLEQDYFFEIANNKIAELDREYSFIDYEILVYSLDFYFDLLKKDKSFECKSLNINCWLDVLKSDLKAKNDFIDDAVFDINKILKEKILDMFVDYSKDNENYIRGWAV